MTVAVPHRDQLARGQVGQVVDRDARVVDVDREPRDDRDPLPRRRQRLDEAVSSKRE
jgi:hypothetical protein